MRILVVNAGSSSLKLRLLDADNDVVGCTDLPADGGRFERDAVAAALTHINAESADAVGHRIVHGGSRFVEATRLDDEVRRALDKLTDLAPLHQPASLAGFDAVHATLPDVPAVACFDTAFHAHLPAAAATYALPARWRETYGLRRYGFHGLSHAYASRRAAEFLDRDPGRLVVCHLGAGASLAAIRRGRSLDTTMGFTPLEGLVMATRSGTIDPGLLLWLHQHARIPIDELADTLEHHSGLLGLAGSGDMGQVLACAADGEERARFALDVYLHRLRAGIAAMTAALGGLDTLVFTGGVGEHAAEIRHRTAQGLHYLGVRLDPTRNTNTNSDTNISQATAPVHTLVLTAREDLQIAADTRRILTH